jgi:2-iminobutanoate/2-iminopropanoate deaminase
VKYRERVATDKAPGAIGPYSQAIVANGLVFCSGQVALDPATSKLIDGDVREQTRRALDNLAGVLAAAGSDLSLALRTTVYLVDMNDFAAMNEVYGGYFADPPPARSTVEVRRLPRDARVEIDVIALLADR